MFRHSLILSAAAVVVAAAPASAACIQDIAKVEQRLLILQGNIDPVARPKSAPAAGASTDAGAQTPTPDAGGVGASAGTTPGQAPDAPAGTAPGATGETAGASGGRDLAKAEAAVKRARSANAEGDAVACAAALEDAVGAMGD